MRICIRLPEDLPRAMELIRRMARLLVNKISRKCYGKKRKPDIRRTIRDNLQCEALCFIKPAPTKTAAGKYVMSPAP